VPEKECSVIDCPESKDENMSKTGIEWTDTTWNPTTGCSKTSDGCTHCYAATMARRLQAMGQEKYRNGFEPTVHEHLIDEPLRWRKPRHVFVNSMSDLFHEQIPERFIRQVFEVMEKAEQHRFQVLTKRSQRLAELAPRLPWPSNVWAGVTVESSRYLHRLDDLRRVPAAIKFVSAEPLLGPLGGIDLNGVNWVIVGGESGPGARPMEPEWVYEIRDQCQSAKVPFFFKQWGGVNKKIAGRLLDGRTWDERPGEGILMPAHVCGHQSGFQAFRY